ncbi:MAG: polyphosphate polymerase domain-containing protein [Muribaculaceae bacterium]|nr:polyphosphate polymerase domain-containing protein [Muribaculaceae bacterium]
MSATLREIISGFAPITLEQMSGIKLMNRTDTKFVTTEQALCELLLLARHDYFAQDIAGERIARYFTAYFDTSEHDMYIMHQNGHVNRQKVRIRSYIDSGLDFLEVKTKNNRGRTKKKRMAMQDFDPTNPPVDLTFRRQNEVFTAYDDFLRTHLFVATPQQLKEQLLNQFNRITLVNRARTERLTIDTALAFNNLRTGQQCDLGGLAIIELKRDGLQPSPILDMLLQLRIKPSGFSKYCMGQALTDPNLKRNRFKPRLRMVDKLLEQAARHTHHAN